MPPPDPLPVQSPAEETRAPEPGAEPAGAAQTPAAEREAAPASDSPAAAAALRDRLRDDLARRRLPPALHARLLELAERVPPSGAGANNDANDDAAATATAADGDPPVLRLSEAAALFEAAMPAHLALVADEARPAEHPGGEAFFTGDAAGLSDDLADHIAQRQLRRSGLAR